MYVRPILKNHFGDIKVTKIENDVVYVKLLGECSCCSYSAYTLEDVIAKLIKKYKPQIKNVCIDTFNEELYLIAKNKAMAKKMIFTGAPISADEALGIGLMFEMHLEEAVNYEAEVFGILCTTKDKEEGAKEFLEKRKPNFIGK